MAHTEKMRILVWEARHDKKLTLKQLSALSGVSKTTLNDIENGKLSPTLNQLEAIARAMNLRITDLFESEYK